jgi:hypothetical protein
MDYVPLMKRPTETALVLGREGARVARYFRRRGQIQAEFRIAFRRLGYEVYEHTDKWMVCVGMDHVLKIGGPVEAEWAGYREALRRGWVRYFAKTLRLDEGLVLQERVLTANDTMVTDVSAQQWREAMPMRESEMWETIAGEVYDLGFTNCGVRIYPDGSTEWVALDFPIYRWRTYWGAGNAGAAWEASMASTPQWGRVL